MRVGSTLLGFVALAIGCSASPNGDTGVATVRSAVAARNIKVIGSLSYGQTSPVVAYVSSPRYYAFSFNGAQADTPEIFVRSPGQSVPPPILLVVGNLIDMIYVTAPARASTT